MASVLRPVGYPVPNVEHAISVSLPTWSDTLKYKRNDEYTLSRMQTGYPRYFIHLTVRKLSAFFESSYGTPAERALLVRSSRAAEACCAFVNARSIRDPARILETLPSHYLPDCQVYVVFVHQESFPFAKQFWQFTGLGISSRIAERYMMLRGLSSSSTLPHSVLAKQKILIQGPNESYLDPPFTAKKIIRKRIANLINSGTESWQSRKMGGSEYLNHCPNVSESDVFLYPMGMTAIWAAHQLCMRTLGNHKSVCLGFPYADTLKILQNWGPGCYFFPDVEEATIDNLESIFETLKASQPSVPPILALFTEFPSNPLLHSVNLPRLRALANTYGFSIVIDETVGNFANVHVMTFADIVITSLSKLFSGNANVTGGSLVLNPLGSQYAKLKEQLNCMYEDIYFDEDVEIMAVNSRDFQERSAVINDNTEAVCDYLRTCSSIITKVYYPKFQHAWRNYDECRIGGYGGLFSVLLASPSAAHAFYDALDCAKGPSLGTNFTLSCPYSLLAHFTELEWAEQHGVPESLVRVSVGMEDKEKLLEMFRAAVQAGENTQSKYV